MLVLHGSVLKDRFLLWGEVPTDGDGLPPPKHKPKTPPITISPFDAGGARLIAAISEVFPGIGKANWPESVHAWLPTLHPQPVPSSPLIGEMPANGKPPRLEPWSIT